MKIYFPFFTKFFLCITFFISVSFSSDVVVFSESGFDVYKVSKKNIDQKQKTIARTLKYHAFLRWAAVAGAVGSAGFVLYKLFHGSSSCVPACKKEQEEKELSDSDLLRLLGSKVDSLKKQNELFEKRLNPPFFSPCWIKKQLISFVSTSAISGALWLGKNLWSDIGTIDWFTEKKMRTYKRISEWDSYVEKIRKEKELTPESFNYYKATLAAICKLIVEDVESLCGFIQHSLQQFEKRGAFLAPNENRLVSYLTTTTNRFIKTLQKNLTKNVGTSLVDLQDAYGKLRDFTNDFNLAISQFKNINTDIEDRLKI